MAKNKPGRSHSLTAMHMQRAALTAAVTSSTSKSLSGSIVEPENELPRAGEKVAIPTSEMMGASSSHDYQKLAFQLALVIAVIGVVWIFAETYFSVKSIGDEVSVLKLKADETFRSNVSAEARITALERTESRISLSGKGQKTGSDSQ